MAGVRVELTLDGRDDPIVATYDARDMRAWEAETGRSCLDGLTVSMLSWFGWSAARRAGLLNGTGESWQAFDAVCVGVRVLGDDPVPPTRRNRTKKTRSDGSSAR